MISGNDRTYIRECLSGPASCCVRSPSNRALQGDTKRKDAGERFDPSRSGRWSVEQENRLPSPLPIRNQEFVNLDRAINYVLGYGYLDLFLTFEVSDRSPIKEVAWRCNTSSRREHLEPGNGIVVDELTPVLLLHLRPAATPCSPLIATSI